MIVGIWADRELWSFIAHMLQLPSFDYRTETAMTLLLAISCRFIDDAQFLCLTLDLDVTGNTLKRTGIVILNAQPNIKMAPTKEVRVFSFGMKVGCCGAVCLTSSFLSFLH